MSIIEQGAQIGENFSIGHFSVIEQGAKIGNNVTIGHNVVIKSSAIIGNNVTIHSFTSIGDDPQVIGFNNKIKSNVLIEDFSVIRENVTIHRGMNENSITKIGKNNYIMACSHVGHDCTLYENVILANNVLLGGFVTVEKNAFLSGSAVFHQFVKIGESAMISGNATISCHVPPFVIASERNLSNGINIIGLKRKNFSSDEVADIKNCYRITYTSTSFKKNAENAINSSSFNTNKGKQFLQFFLSQQYDRQFICPKFKF